MEDKVYEIQLNSYSSLEDSETEENHLTFTINESSINIIVLINIIAPILVLNYKILADIYFMYTFYHQPA